MSTPGETWPVRDQLLMNLGTSSSYYGEYLGTGVALSLCKLYEGRKLGRTDQLQ